MMLNVFSCFVTIILLLTGLPVRGELLFSYDEPSAARAFSRYETKKLFHYYVRYQDPIFIAGQITKLFPDVGVVEYANNTLIGLYTTPEKFRALEPVIQTLDHPVHQVRIDVTVVELAANRLDEIGIKWAKDVTLSDTKPCHVSFDSDVLARLKAAQQKGLARIKAQPALTVKDNCKASVQIGDKVPIAVPQGDREKESYGISFIEAGVKLAITPQVVSENYIHATVQPEVSSIKGWQATITGEYPIISTKEATTEVTVRSGETFVIAGLTNRNNSSYTIEVPFLSQIPLIGGFFRYSMTDSSETEVLFLIKPTLVKRI